MVQTKTLPVHSMSTSGVSAAKVAIPPAMGGLVNLPGITPEASKAASEILQDNHDVHHIFFNNEGFHNHIVHLILAQYDMGAPASIMRDAYKRESGYQRPQMDAKKETITELADESKWGQFLGNEKYYSSFLEYFRKQIDAIGWQETIQKTLFSGTKLADDMLARLFAGFVHPFIHLGYGVEFELPAIIAEGLAETAMHTNKLAAFFVGAEMAAETSQDKTKTLSALLDEIRDDPKVSKAALWEDAQKVDAVLERAGDEMISYAKQFKVPLDQIERGVAESISAAAQFCGGAIRKDKQIKFDFYYMHSHNSSMFLSTFCSQDWISPENKARLIEWKSRVDLAMYASRRAPPLLLDEIRTYTPKDKTSTNPWMGVVNRGLRYEDDGHCIKFLRALANGEKVTRKYWDEPGFEIKGDMWMKLAEMCMDSCEDHGETHPTRWVRSAGFDEAWEKFGPRKYY